MMRQLLLVAVAATLLPLGYIYGPEFLKQASATPEAVVEPVPVAPQPMTQVTLERPQVIAAPQKVSEKPSVTKLAPAKAVHKKASLKSKKVKSKSNSRAEVLPNAPDLKPAGADKSQKNSTLVASASGKRSMYQQRNFSDPMKDRWISELSGQRAALSMGKTRIDRDCQKTTVGCADQSNGREAKLVGVVMESERVMERPASPLEGKVVRGRYDRGTPAVYVK